MKHLVINTWNRKSKINPNIYGHFAEHLGRCIYGGIYVGKDSPIPNRNGIRLDIVESMKQIRVPLLRWPGGCFADTYHWKDAVGPQEQRKGLQNPNWGNVSEDNSFGSHEFMELCEMVGCEPYLAVNVGSGTVQEMQEWIEYMTSDGNTPMTRLRRQNGREKPWKVKYWGIGNENWGCGGKMRPEYYADVYRNFQTFAYNYADNELYKIACGPAGPEWTDVMMREAGDCMHGLALHHYTVPGPSWQDKGSATGFDEVAYYKTLSLSMNMDKILSLHSGIMNRWDPEHKVGLVVDEWGTWFNVEPGTHPRFLYQQNTMRDALVAGIHLNIFNKHAKRVSMANLAQTVNVLQALILTDGDKMLLTPTYHVFDLYKHHQGNTLIDSFVQSDTIGGEHPVPNLQASVSEDAEGNLHLTLCNLSATQGEEVEVMLLGKQAVDVAGEMLAGGMGDHNTFESPNAVGTEQFTAFEKRGENVLLKLPPCSVAHIQIETK